MYHGGVLSPQTNQLRPGVTALILLDHRQAARGYRVGREAFFHEPGPEYRDSEHTLIERLQEIVSDAPRWKEPESTWNYVLGCLFGELSDPLFPETQEEQAWRAECRKWGSEQVQEARVLQRSAILQEA